MPAAPSDARNTATSTTSASLGARHSAAIPAIISTTDRGSGAFAPPTSVSFFSDSVSATPAVQMPQTRTPRSPDAADADTARSHLGRQVPHERLGCCVGWSGAAHTRHRPGPRRAVEVQDHAEALLDHESPRGARGTEVAAQAVDHGPQEVVSRNLDQRVPWTSPRLMRLNDTYTEKPLWSPAAYRQLDSVGKLNTHEHIRR